MKTRPMDLNLIRDCLLFLYKDFTKIKENNEMSRENLLKKDDE
jgi:hypothetical protein